MSQLGNSSCRYTLLNGLTAPQIKADFIGSNDPNGADSQEFKLTVATSDF